MFLNACSGRFKVGLKNFSFVLLDIPFSSAEKWAKESHRHNLEKKEKNQTALHFDRAYSTKVLTPNQTLSSRFTYINSIDPIGLVGHADD